MQIKHQQLRQNGWLEGSVKKPYESAPFGNRQGRSIMDCLRAGSEQVNTSYFFFRTKVSPVLFHHGDKMQKVQSIQVFEARPLSSGQQDSHNITNAQTNARSYARTP